MGWDRMGWLLYAAATSCCPTKGRCPSLSPVLTPWRQGEGGGGQEKGLKIPFGWKSLDFISPFQCEFFAAFHSDITLRFSIASEFLPINGKTINVHLEK